MNENVSSNEAFAAALAVRMLMKVEQFNVDIVNLPIPAKPTMMSDDRCEWTNSALQEEVAEFNQACSDGDILEAADALVDLVYFALGRLTEMGVPAMMLFDEVQRANMDKKQGSLSKRPGSLGHDAIKPEGWQPPDHQLVLGFTLQDAQALAELRNKQAQREDISPIWLELQELRETKGQDYNNVPGGREAYFPFGHQSYAHMIHTKNLRLQSLLNAMLDGRLPNYEGLYDTAKDLVNYGTYYAEWLKRQGYGATNAQLALPLEGAQ
ncbi:HAD superfamily hydrolase [Stenotrophomonas phage A1432]|uniref:HAD superfamily hydrolase n=1 Tax=Stenotrophomonas phage A1432 TaxID=2930315 RepID=A0A9E7SQM6_9CAUD|nr:HAD superfamily hydrolase [Stenotrophomonas phage A1432]UTC27997.1 HAD superfamily hydrolase [Stenotrophomonas phage A1432]